MNHAISTWIQALKDQPFPALRENIAEIHRLLDSGSSSLAETAQIINRDPGLACLFFRHINKARFQSGRPLISTIESSLNLLGSESIRTLIDQAEVLEDRLNSAETVEGWHRLILRHYHAARIAQEWAGKQSDRAPSEIYIATFLMGIGEFCVAMADSKIFNELLLRQPGQLKQAAELELLGTSTREIGSELARQWALPELLQDVLNPDLMLNHRVQLCSIPQLLAYEADLNGWNTSPMNYAYEMAAQILRQSLPNTASMIHQQSVGIAREMELPSVRPAAIRLVQLSAKPSKIKQREEPRNAGEPALKILTATLSHALKDNCSANELIKLALNSLGTDFGFTRTLLLLPDADKKRLLIRAAPGFAKSPLLKRARLRIDRSGIFQSAMSKSQAIWIHDENFPKIAAGVPEEFSMLTQSVNFMLFSIAIAEKPMALIYADLSGQPLNPGQAREASGFPALLSRALSRAVRPA